MDDNQDAGQLKSEVPSNASSGVYDVLFLVLLSCTELPFSSIVLTSSLGKQHLIQAYVSVSPLLNTSFSINIITTASLLPW